ncbi:MAG: fused MFS/spermidine synthase [Acidobacteriota bacterium]|nr:fused MFS/spermidine synthase [Acidobacteriota bacterium]
MPILRGPHPGRLDLGKPLPALLLGFLATTFQIYFMREFSAHFYGNELSFGFVLASWLLWGGLGSLSASKIRFSPKRFARMYLAIIILFPLSLGILRLSRFIMRLSPGETTGMFPMLLFSISLTCLINLPLGLLFVWNARNMNGDVARVYFWESAGAALGGILVNFGLIPLFSNWRGAAIIGILATLAVLVLFERKSTRPFLLLAWLVLAAAFVLDFPAQKYSWRPFRLVEARDTPHGKLQAIKTEEQVSLYSNGLLAYSSADIAAAEESVHFALIQVPRARDVLLVGGGVGGGLREVLKYPETRVDYVEIDPQIIAMSRRLLPDEELRPLLDARVRLFNEDGRAFLQSTPKKYDAVILNLPEPATAQLNRFYTKEFFELARRHLTGGGVFSFRVPSAENYISRPLQGFLAVLFATLASVFPEVEVVPGDSNIFLASSAPLSIGLGAVGGRVAALGLDNAFVRREMLVSRLDPARIEYLKNKMRGLASRLNRDLSPVCYFFNSVLWASQFHGAESKLLGFFSGLPSFWLLDVPLALYVITLAMLAILKKPAARYLAPLATMGFTTIVLEIIILLAFQTFWGYVYSQLALLLTMFMGGLALGSWLSLRRKKTGAGELAVIQGAFVGLLLIAHASVIGRFTAAALFALLLALGTVSGYLFVVANRLYLALKEDYGRGYAADMLGSFLGALFVSAVIIPLIGIPTLIMYLAVMNSFCLLFVAAASR